MDEDSSSTNNNNNNTEATPPCSLPPGYRFYPTEEELLTFYLANKLNHEREEAMHRLIPIVNVNRIDPWHLPRISGEASVGDSEQWFFFCPRQQSEVHGGKPARTTPSGYWKATGSPGDVYSSSTNRAIGVKKTMVFYRGRAPTGTKTKWKMNEYRSYQEDHSVDGAPSHKVCTEFSMCRVYVTTNCLRSFDRRPEAAPSASTSLRIPEEVPIASAESSRATKRRRSVDSSSSDGDGGGGGGGPSVGGQGGANEDEMPGDAEWESLDWFLNMM